MVKILQINSVSNAGSTGRIAEGIAKKIRENNWKSYIAFGRYYNKSIYSEEIKFSSKIETYLHVLITRLFALHGFGSYFATKSLIKKIDKIKPDIIHLHNLHGYYMNIKLLFNYLKKNNIKVVWTMHDCWAFTGHCSHYESVNCYKWETICENCPQKKEYPKSFFDNSKENFINKKKIFSSLENLTIIAPSHWLKSSLEKSYFSKYNIITINNGINLDVFNKKNISSLKSKLNLKDEKIILGVSNVWNKKKGLYDFIELSEVLNVNYKIILVGLSASQIEKLPKRIIGVERTQNVNELAQYYSMADVFFNPTYEDTFPTTNIEALACGTKVITYKTGGSSEIVDEATGFVIEKKDFKGLLKILQNVKKTDESEIKCVKRASELFNENETFKNYIKIYDELIKKK